MRTFFARIGHTLLLLMMMSGLALPLQVHAQYELDSFEFADQALMNGDADGSIPVIVIPDDTDDTPIGGNCRGGPCVREEESSSSSIASSASSSVSSRAQVPQQPLRPAAPKQPVTPVDTRSPQELKLLKAKVAKYTESLLKNREIRKLQRLESFCEPRIENGILARGFNPASEWHGWRWNDYRLPVMFANFTFAIPLIGLWRRKRNNEPERKPKSKKKHLTRVAKVIVGKKTMTLYLGDILAFLLISILIGATLIQNVSKGTRRSHHSCAPCVQLETDE